MADERVEGGGQPAQQRVSPARPSEGERDGADALGGPPDDPRPLVQAERPDAIAGPEEREVRADHPVEQATQVRLDAPLDRRFRALRVAGVERAAGEEDS